MDLGSKTVLKLISFRWVERLKGQVGVNAGHQHLGDNMLKQWQRWVSVQQWESEVVENIINHEHLLSRVIDVDAQEFNMISDHSDRAFDNGWGGKVIGVHRVQPTSFLSPPNTSTMCRSTSCYISITMSIIWTISPTTFWTQLVCYSYYLLTSTCIGLILRIQCMHLLDLQILPPIQSSLSFVPYCSSN